MGPARYVTKKGFPMESPSSFIFLMRQPYSAFNIQHSTLFHFHLYSLKRIRAAIVLGGGSPGYLFVVHHGGFGGGAGYSLRERNVYFVGEHHAHGFVYGILGRRT